MNCDAKVEVKLKIPWFRGDSSLSQAFTSHRIPSTENVLFLFVEANAF